MYAIRHKPSGKFFAIAVDINISSDKTLEVIFEFVLSSQDTFFDNNVWVTLIKDQAEKAIISRRKMYNSTFECPVNSWTSEDLEVVELKEA